jgi:hypothetical protein
MNYMEKDKKIVLKVFVMLFCRNGAGFFGRAQQGGIEQRRVLGLVSSQPPVERIQAPVLNLRGQGEWQALRGVQLRGLQGLLQAHSPERPVLCLPRGQKLHHR